MLLSHTISQSSLIVSRIELETGKEKGGEKAYRSAYSDPWSDP